MESSRASATRSPAAAGPGQRAAAGLGAGAVNAAVTSAPREPQRAGQVLVAPVDVAGAAHLGLPLGHQAGQHQRRPGPDVGGPDRGAREPVDPADHGVVALGPDVGAHPAQLVDVAEAARRRGSR